MKTKVLGLLFGAGIGFVFAWAWLSDPVVIRNMLLLREPDVFLFMGSAVVIAAIGTRLLRLFGARALATGELVTWTVERPERRHVLGSVLFGAGWAVAGTCPGPVAVMIGEGRLGGIVVAIGLAAGVLLQGARQGRRLAAATNHEIPRMAGL
jgi:uncharacterized protein